MLPKSMLPFDKDWLVQTQSVHVSINISIYKYIVSLLGHIEPISFTMNSFQDVL